LKKELNLKPHHDKLLVSSTSIEKYDHVVRDAHKSGEENTSSCG
jgi:hypothetical protein